MNLVTHVGCLVQKGIGGSSTELTRAFFRKTIYSTMVNTIRNAGVTMTFPSPSRLGKRVEDPTLMIKTEMSANLHFSSKPHAQPKCNE